MKSLSQRITEMRGEHWHVWKSVCISSMNKYSCECGKVISYGSMKRPYGYGNPDYKEDANKYMMLFQELPHGHTLGWNEPKDSAWIENNNEIYLGGIGEVICKAWNEAFKCKECVDGFVFDEGGSGICNVPCPKCNGTGSIFKKEGG